MGYLPCRHIAECSVYDEATAAPFYQPVTCNNSEWKTKSNKYSLLSTMENFLVSTEDLQALTLLRPTRENLLFSCIEPQQPTMILS